MALSATFVADFSSFMDATKAAVTAMQGFKLSAEELGPAADRGLNLTQKQMEQTGRAARQVGTDALGAAKIFLDAYAEEEAATNRLNTALQATGQATPAVIQQYADLAEQFQNTTTQSDDAITNIQAVLTTIGKVGPEQMELALTATTNLASALKIDLNTAANMVATSIGGTHEPVRKIKELLGETYDPADDAATVLRKITDATGPAAQNELNTYAGSMKQLDNFMGSFNATIGRLLDENIKPMIAYFKELPGGVQTFTIAAIALGVALAPLLVSIGALVGIVGGIPLAFAAALTAMLALGAYMAPKAWGQLNDLVAMFKDVSVKIIGYAKAIYDGVKLWMVDKLNWLANQIMIPIQQIAYWFQWLRQILTGGSIVPDMVSEIGAEFAKLDALMVDPVRTAATDAQREFDRLSASAPDGGAFAGLTGARAAGGAAGGTVVNITMTGLLGTNDPQTRQAITQVVGDALAHSMRGQRLLSTA